jgi:hypothetical protein
MPKHPWPTNDDVYWNPNRSGHWKSCERSARYNVACYPVGWMPLPSAAPLIHAARKSRRLSRVRRLFSLPYQAAFTDLPPSTWEAVEETEHHVKAALVRREHDALLSMLKHSGIDVDKILAAATQ